MKSISLPLRSRAALVLSVGFAALSLIAVPASQAGPTKSTPTKDQVTFFETKIRPVFADQCYMCHGPKTQMGGLRLDSLAAMEKGGQSGPAIVPGEPNKSLLVIAVRQSGLLKMPQGGKLTSSQVADIENWVEAGAPWPAASDTKALDPMKFWSLRPVKMPPMPTVKDKGWEVNALDAFVLAKLEASGLHPAKPADRRTLLRRVTYDLTGLPPTIAETEVFIQDKSPNAYGKVVDRLLASPHYGERWARHWLDVARYSDTKGYVFNEDRNYYNAYTYRDWVINAFNKDLPYDQFIEQQLAADRLPAVRNGDDKTPLAALGYLTLGRRFLNSQPDIIDDRIDVTMRGFEGMTVECARCHDHKFDPIPTQDYYSLYAVFKSSDEVASPISDKAIREPWQQYNSHLSSDEASIRQIVQEQVERLRKMTDTPDGQGGLNADIKKTLQGFRVEELPNDTMLAKLKPAFEAKELERLNSLEAEVASLKKNPPPTPELAMAMEDAQHPSDGVVFKRGNPGIRGEPAPRRFLLALSKPGVEREHWDNDSGRLELAEAIASKTNPLTARVFVNRVWQDHFGAAIVRTPSDFGHQGERPTDPKLLDYLAATFMNDGWSIKRLQRLIVTSATYRQSSDASANTLNADPDNRLWSRMNRRRLDLEEVRDSLMDVARKLDLSKIGGKSVDLWSKPYTERRAVYGFIERQNLPGIFRTFDFASPDSTSARRFVTTVPQQALFFMNSALCVQDAQAVASQPQIAGASDDGQRIRRLYLTLFQRLPDKDEAANGLAYLHLPPPSDTSSASVWRYGFGEFQPSSGRVAFFTPFDEYSKAGYHPGKAFPDLNLGYLLLSAQGGHPGRDQKHCVVRRWIAPATMTIQIHGEVVHGQPEGDGICARIVSSRLGMLGEWKVHNSRARTELASVSVVKGDTIDFVVDPQTNDAYDGFAWAPAVGSADGRQVWNAAGDFAAPPGPPPSRVALYAQALMMTNEFMFVD